MDQTGVKNFLSNIFTLWLTPEIELRRKNNSLKSGFSLNKAQIIFTVDGKKIIRLNEEIKALIKTNLRKVDDMRIDISNINESIERLDRIEEEEDFGHVTILKIRELWVIAFDFRYGISSSGQFFGLGLEFLKASKFSNENRLYQAAASNLFFAMENFMKARFLLYPDAIKRKSKTHRELSGQVSINYKHFKIINSEYKKEYDFLKDLYDKGVRYNPNFKVNKTKIKNSLIKVENFSNEIFRLYNQKLIYKT